jgi:hypothetical protein
VINLTERGKGTLAAGACLHDNITLSSCTINGEPGVAITMIDEVGEGKVAIMPLFVALTPSMELIASQATANLLAVAMAVRRIRAKPSMPMSR